MGQELDERKKLEVYALVLSRYKELINEKESRSVSEIRARASPYTDFVRSKASFLLNDIAPYEYKRHFLTALERSLNHVRSIETCEFAFTFWMSFEEMERLGIGTAMDKALLLCALLRYFESPDAAVVVTRSGQWTVRFSHEGIGYAILPGTGSMLSGEDVESFFSKDPPSYSFNDLSFDDFD